MNKLQWIQNKIMDKAALLRFCNSQKVNGRKIVFTNGCFDIIHHGHIDLLSKAADEGHILIVAINTDTSVRKLKGEERPVNNEQDRALQLAALLCVDAVCFFEEDTPLNLIRFLNPDVLVKGGDYTIDTIVGAKEVQESGGKVAIIPFVNGYSTSGLINKIKSL
ncbi:MAG: D-glycero-beta-D-manno-heptose 1-phosphate adenylyltransferase [Chitinophagaceae bacterium]|jgi:D-beta-D-heptose 7-phosphate kinase/D-beta-D-heptose 1-phosphate adenosyltransferase